MIVIVVICVCLATRACINVVGRRYLVPSIGSVPFSSNLVGYSSPSIYTLVRGSQIQCQTVCADQSGGVCMQAIWSRQNQTCTMVNTHTHTQ